MTTPASQPSNYALIDWSGRAPTVSTAHLAAFDTTQVWLGNDRQLRYWTGELGVTVYEILDAIAFAKTRCAIAVRKCLER